MDDSIPEKQQSMKSVAAFVFFSCHGCAPAKETCGVLRVFIDPITASVHLFMC